jgi:vitamin B12/bleomycin/antimicrobial peptide transport system ATP-binding/permease protein
LQRPRWVVVNDALDVLDPESRARIRALMANEYADIGIINIGHDQPESDIYHRRLHIVMDPLGATFRPDREHGIPEPPKSAAESVSAE